MYILVSWLTVMYKRIIKHSKLFFYFEKIEKSKNKKLFLFYGGNNRFENKEVEIIEWNGLSDVSKLKIF